MTRSHPINPNDPAPQADDPARNYLQWLAGRRGIDLPERAIYRLDGIWSDIGRGAALLLAMPGYGASQVVTMETLDEAGNVIRSQSVTNAKRGGISLSADQVLAATGLTKGRKSRASKPRFPLDPRHALRMTAAEMQAYCDAARAGESVAAVPAEPAAVIEAAPVDETSTNSDPVAPVLEADPAPVDVAALVARIATLEAAVDQLLLYTLQAAPPAVEMTAAPDRGNGDAVAPDQRSDAERRAIVRAWRMRGEMRARADLDRRALQAANGAYRGAVDALGASNAERDAARAKVERLEFDAVDMAQQLAAATARANAAEAVTMPALDEAHGRLVKLEREVATWRGRAEGAGWRPTFNVAGLMGTAKPRAA
ncbi:MULTISPECIES: hypothetical protein [unclassified Sphingomonas]|uniref:hypothetical protein n=1 Tax=unclassified Sphingomonas TaxID=196159 RepID=UPI00226A1353|nr:MULTISPECIES: hypothetical protein [unclassified Sphingomonas]